MNRSEDKFLFQRGKEYFLSRFMRVFYPEKIPKIKWEYVRQNKEYAHVTIVEHDKENALKRLEDIKKQDIDSNIETWTVFYND